jgi:Icc-related predicted phosphoesterase
VQPCLFVTDLHGRPGRWRALFDLIERERPAGVFLGGDLFPGALAAVAVPTLRADTFARDVVFAGFARLRERLGGAYPAVFAILGNDDGRFLEPTMMDGAVEHLWTYAHDRRVGFGPFTVYGYAYVPPTPFALKDWERYDVSRFVDPGAVSPEEGRRTVPVDPREVRHATIARDLESLAGDDDLDHAVFLFHSPPYDTVLDRAALDGRKIDHVPLDVHVGSIAIRRFLETRGPRVSLHGHVHEAARLTGDWRQRIGQTWALGAAHDGEGLAVVRFDPGEPSAARREIVPEIGDR